MYLRDLSDRGGRRTVVPNPSALALGQLYYSDDGRALNAATEEDRVAAMGLQRLMTVATSTPQSNFHILPVKFFYKQLRKAGLDPIAFRLVHAAVDTETHVEMQSVYTFYGPLHPRQ